MAQSAVPVVIDCSTTWCGPCKVFEPVFRQFAEARLANLRLFVPYPLEVSHSLTHVLPIHCPSIAPNRWQPAAFHARRSAEVSAAFAAGWLTLRPPAGGITISLCL